MLRIKRSVQAQFNTEASFLAAQALAARGDGQEKQVAASAESDPMQAMEAAANGTRSGFVAARHPTTKETPESLPDAAEPERNTDEIQISDEEL